MEGIKNRVGNSCNCIFVPPEVMPLPWHLCLLPMETKQVVLLVDWYNWYNYKCVYIYIYTCVCIYIYTHVYVYIYIYGHINVASPRRHKLKRTGTQLKDHFFKGRTIFSNTKQVLAAASAATRSLCDRLLLCQGPQPWAQSPKLTTICWLPAEGTQCGVCACVHIYIYIRL